MKKLVLLLFLLIPINVFALDIDITSNNAVLYNMNEDSILYEKNKDEEVSIASLTKIMTSIVALENINNLDDKVVLTKEDFYGLVEANAAVAGFRVGEEVTYRDLLYGLMLPSGADAAQALMRTVSGSEEEFINLMNKKSSDLGLKHSHFVNPTGLDIDNHYSSVYDVATIFKYALENEEFKKLITTSTYTTSNSRLTFRSTISKAISNYNLSMDYVLGGKTGTTDNAGLCLATIAEKDGVNFLLVTAKAPYSKVIPNNYNDHIKIYEYFMNNYSYKNIVEKNDLLVKINTLYAKKNYIEFKSNKSISKYLENSFSKDKVKYKYIGKDTITLDMKKGTKLGRVDIIYNDKVLDSIDIKLNEKLELDIGKYLMGHKIIIIIPSIIFVLLILLVIFKRKKCK